MAFCMLALASTLDVIDIDNELDEGGLQGGNVGPPMDLPEGPDPGISQTKLDARTGVITKKDSANAELADPLFNIHSALASLQSLYAADLGDTADEKHSRAANEEARISRLETAVTELKNRAQNRNQNATQAYIEQFGRSCNGLWDISEADGVFAFLCPTHVTSVKNPICFVSIHNPSVFRCVPSPLASKRLAWGNSQASTSFVFGAHFFAAQLHKDGHDGRHAQDRHVIVTRAANLLDHKVDLANPKIWRVIHSKEWASKQGHFPMTILQNGVLVKTDGRRNPAKKHYFIDLTDPASRLLSSPHELQPNTNANPDPNSKMNGPYATYKSYVVVADARRGNGRNGKGDLVFLFDTSGVRNGTVRLVRRLEGPKHRLIHFGDRLWTDSEGTLIVQTHLDKSFRPGHFFFDIKSLLAPGPAQAYQMEPPCNFRRDNSFGHTFATHKGRILIGEIGRNARSYCGGQSGRNFRGAVHIVDTRKVVKKKTTNKAEVRLGLSSSSGGNCRSFCGRVKRSWTQKCKWTYCKGCRSCKGGQKKGKTSCTDEPRSARHCHNWKRRGYCRHHSIQKRCKRSCGKCSSASGQTKFKAKTAKLGNFITTTVPVQLFAAGPPGSKRFGMHIAVSVAGLVVISDPEARVDDKLKAGAIFTIPLDSPTTGRNAKLKRITATVPMQGMAFSNSLSVVHGLILVGSTNGGGLPSPHPEQLVLPDGKITTQLAVFGGGMKHIDTKVHILAPGILMVYRGSGSGQHMSILSSAVPFPLSKAKTLLEKLKPWGEGLTKNRKSMMPLLNCALILQNNALMQLFGKWSVDERGAAADAQIIMQVNQAHVQIQFLRKVKRMECTSEAGCKAFKDIKSPKPVRLIKNMICAVQSKVSSQCCVTKQLMPTPQGAAKDPYMSSLKLW